MKSACKKHSSYLQDIFVRQLIFSQKIKHRLSNLKKSAALFCHYYQKHYLCNHISHIIKEIRKPYELDYSDCCRIL